MQKQAHFNRANGVMSTIIMIIWCI